MGIVEVISSALVAIGILLLVCVFVLFVEVLASLPKVRASEPSLPQRPRIAVIVPAHNEEIVIKDTLASVFRQLTNNDRLIVVADNCTDETARIARLAGGEVIVRNDLTRRGKGFALDFGVHHLLVDPPDVVIVIDADCRPEEGAILKIASASAASGRPAQAYDRIVAPKDMRTPYLLMACFAVRVKNLVRPLGCHRMGLPCQLMGTGMAFPWGVIRTLDMATSEIVEDLAYGLDLARKGYPPLFCPNATVTSTFPASSDGQQTQRTRWESGHLNAIVKRLPDHFLYAVRRRDLALLALVLDAAVPPLSFLALAIAGFTLLASLFAIIGPATGALTLAIACSLIFVIAVLLAWWRAGRDVISLSELALAPAYAFSKLGLYGSVLIGRKVEWIRSKRDTH
jgi:cellulose synthase/poly-beta-1,6-N-acetylglucosamine synthase-like glycosyltransferase